MNKFKTEYKRISSKYLTSEPSYQREVDPARVRKIVTNFNPNLVNPCKVSLRGGKFYVFDGQHTLRALESRNNNKPVMVECKIYYDMTLEDEAKLFAEQNGYCREVESKQKFLSLYVAKDVDIIDFKETIESTGIRCDFKKSTLGDHAVVCYKSLYNIFQKEGKEHLKDLLELILKIWNGEAQSLRKEIIVSIDMFINTYKDEYDHDRLISKLSKISPLTIYRDGKAIVTGGNKRFARIILNIYNKGKSKNKLEDRL